MSRAFFPPDTLSRSDIQTIADVRRQIWTGGFLGLGTGLLTGIGVHYILGVTSRRFNVLTPPSPRPDFSSMPPIKGMIHELLYHSNPTSRNSRVLFCLGFGALMSYLGAASAGKNNVVFLQSIYERGKMPVLTDYQQRIEDAKWKEDHNPKEDYQTRR